MCSVAMSCTSGGPAGARTPRASTSAVTPRLSIVRSPGVSISAATEPIRGSRSSGATSRSRQSGRSRTSLLSSTTYSPSPDAHPAVHRRACSPGWSRARRALLRPVAAQQRRGAVAGAVVDHDRAVGERLARQVLEAVARQRVAVVDGNDDVDRGGHGSHARGCRGDHAEAWARCAPVWWQSLSRR